MLLQVHDELVFECPPEEVEPVSEMVKREMEGVCELEVPLLVDIGSRRQLARREITRSGPLAPGPGPVEWD